MLKLSNFVTLLLVCCSSFGQITRPNNLLKAIAASASSGPITFVGATVSPTDNGSDTTGTRTLTPPAGMQAGDWCMVICQVRFTQANNNGYDLLDFTDASGQTWNKHFYKDQATVANSIWVYQCRFNGTWSGTGGNIAVTDGGYTQGTTWWVGAFRPGTSGNVMDIDVMPVGGNFAAGSGSFTKTNSAITTLHDNALVVSIWGSVDDNTYGNLTSGWNTPGSAQYRNLGGSDQSLCVAYKVQATAGTTGQVTVDQTALGGDAGIMIMLSMYEHAPGYPGTSPPAESMFLGMENSTDGTAVTPTILNADTHGSIGTWAEASTPETTSKISTTQQHNLNGKAITVGGTTYDGTGTRSMKYDHTHQSVSGYYGLSLTSTTTKISQGFWFRFGKTYGTSESWTGNGFIDNTQAGGSSKYLVFGCTTTRADRYEIGIHTDTTATVTTGTPIYGFINTWYYGTILWDGPNTIAKFAMYDTSNNQVGLTVNIRLVTPNPINTVVWGCEGGAAVDDAAGTSYFDSMFVDLTGVFPLAPG